MTTITIHIDPLGGVTMTSQASLLDTSSAIYSVRTALTTVAVPIGSSIEDLTELIIQADPNNSVDIVIGSSSNQSWVLPPADTFKLPVRNPGIVYAKAVSGTANVNVFGRKGT